MEQRYAEYVHLLAQWHETVSTWMFWSSVVVGSLFLIAVVLVVVWAYCDDYADGTDMFVAILLLGLASVLLWMLPVIPLAVKDEMHRASLAVEYSDAIAWAETNRQSQVRIVTDK